MRKSRKSRTVLFFPDRPSHDSVEYKLCAILGLAVTSNPNRRAGTVMKRSYDTVFDDLALRELRVDKEVVINGRCLDISKANVAKAVRIAFGYALEVDATKYSGAVVEKSNDNATHDGRIINAPLDPKEIRPKMVYQRVVDNRVGNDEVLDYRVAVHGDTLPLVYLKYRALATRFSNENLRVEVQHPSGVFSESEQRGILECAQALSMDYGELDVLRDRDGRIFVVDANSTPAGPPNGLPAQIVPDALESLSASFGHFLESWRLGSLR